MGGDLPLLPFGNPIGFVPASRGRVYIKPNTHNYGGLKMASEKEGSIVGAILWMFVISILLFWLPFIGPLIAGIVGGNKAGGVGSAIIAVFLPGIVIGIVLFALASSLTGVPLLGAVAGAGGLVLSFAQIGPLLIGAVIGGFLA